jgi:TetR/AcrR family transcriptional repressor of nem operon
MRTTRSEATRHRLLDEGLAILIDRGYNGTGLQELVDRAEVPKGSFYSYFSSKEAFGAEVVRHYSQESLDALNRALREAKGNARERLSEHYARQAERQQVAAFSKGCLVGNLAAEVAPRSDRFRTALAGSVERMRDRLAQEIEAGQEDGSIRADVPARVLADLLYNAWEGALLRMKVEQSLEPLEQVRELVVDGLLRG